LTNYVRLCGDCYAFRMIMQNEGAAMTPAVVAGGGGAQLRRGRGTGALLACLGTAGVLLSAGCSGSASGVAQPFTPPPSATSSVSPSPTPSSRTLVLTQYAAFWSHLTAVSEAAAADRRQMLSAFATNPALNSLLKGMATADRKGQVFYGQDLPRPRLTRLSDQDGVAVVDDCQDSSHSGIADKSTGRHLTVGVSRNHVVVTMHRGDDGQWRVAFVSYTRTKC